MQYHLISYYYHFPLAFSGCVCRGPALQLYGGPFSPLSAVYAVDSARPGVLSRIFSDFWLSRSSGSSQALAWATAG